MAGEEIGWFAQLLGFLSNDAYDGAAFWFAVAGVPVTAGLALWPKMAQRRKTAQREKQIAEFAPARLEERRKVFGRDQTAADLRTLLAESKATAITPVATGTGGAGKTTLARHYAQTYAGDYAMRRVLRAETEQSLVTDLAAIGRELDRSVGDYANDRAAAAEALTLIERDAAERDWLLIYDNVPMPKDLDRWKARGAKCHVIVTSRFPDWHGAGYAALPLPRLSRRAAIDLLKNEAGREDPGFRDLAEELGDLPLALVQAGEWLRVNEKTAAKDYVLTLEKLRRRDPLPGVDPEVSRTMAAVVENTLTILTPDARAVLDVVAWWAPEGLTPELFTEPGKLAWPRLRRWGVPRQLRRLVRDPDRVRRAFEDLRLAALLEDAEVAGRYRLHRVHAEVVRGLARRSRNKGFSTARAAAALVRVTYPTGARNPQDPANWDDCRRLTPHGAAIWQKAEALWDGAWGQPDWAAMDTLLNQMSLFSFTQEDRAANLAAKRASLRLMEARLGQADRDLPAALGNLGSSLARYGGYAEAAGLLDRAVALNREHRSKSKELGASLIQRAQLELERHEAGAEADQAGDLAAAEGWISEAKGFFEALEDQGRVAWAWNTLGYLHRLAGRAEAGAKAYEQAYRLSKAIPGVSRADLARDVMNAGSARLEAGQAEAAEPLLREAYGIRAEIHAQTRGHSDLRNSAEWLVSCLIVRGAEAEAREIAAAEGLDWDGDAAHRRAVAGLAGDLLHQQPQARAVRLGQGRQKLINAIRQRGAVGCDERMPGLGQRQDGHARVAVGGGAGQHALVLERADGAAHLAFVARHGDGERLHLDRFEIGEREQDDGAARTHAGRVEPRRLGVQHGVQAAEEAVEIEGEACFGHVGCVELVHQH